MSWHITPRYILVLVDPRLNIFLLAGTLICDGVWLKLVMQVFRSEQYYGIPEIRQKKKLVSELYPIRYVLKIS
jgi:hypothetical protein